MKTQRKHRRIHCICAFPVVMITKITYVVWIKRRKSMREEVIKELELITDEEKSFIWRKAEGRMGHLFIKR